MSDRMEQARTIARRHYAESSDCLGLFHVTRKDGDKHGEPLKLLEVRRDTPMIGVFPIRIAAEDACVLSDVEIVIVAVPEFIAISEKALKLPEGWDFCKPIPRNSL